MSHTYITYRRLEHMDYVIRVYPRSIRSPVNANPNRKPGDAYDIGPQYV